MRTRTAESLAEHDAEFNERWSQDDLFKEDPDEFRQWKEEQDVRKQVMWDQLERRRKRELELAAGATPTPEDGVQPPRVSNVDLPRRGSGSAPSSPSSRDRSPLPETWQENAGPSTGPAASAESRYAMRSPPGATRVVAKRPREPDAPAAATEDSPRKKRAIDDSRPTRLSPRRALVNAKFRGATVLADSTASTPASRMTPPSIPVGAKHKDKAMTVDPQPTDSNGANMDIDAHERTAPIEDQSNVTVNTSRRPAQYSGSKVKSDCALGPVETKGSALAPSIAPKRRGTAPGTLSRGNVTLESTPNTSLVKKTAGARREPTAAQLRKAEKAEKEREKKEREALFAREKKMTHPEYITYLADKVYVNPRATVCKGLVFLYVHCEPNRVSDQSRQRYVIMYNKLGAEVVQTYSERVTHIIVERNGLERQLVIACHITSADELPPRVKTFTWDWVVYCLTYKRIPPPEHDANYERFPKRLVLVLNARAKKLAPPPRKRDGDDTTDEEEEEPSLPTVSQDESSLPTPVIPVFAQASSSSAKRSSDVQIAKSRTEVDQQLPKLASTSSSHPRTSGAHDPLAEFYEEAMFQLEDRMSDDEWDELEEKAARKTKQTVGSMDGQASGSNGKGKQLKGFQCDNVGGHLKPDIEGPNEDIAAKLEELCSIHAAKDTRDDLWRVKAYRTAVPQIRAHPTRIKSAREACQLRGVGQKTAEKIMEIINTGSLERLATERKGGMESLKLFKGIYGIGSKRAMDFIASGCRTLDDIRERKGGIKLTAGQEIGLRYYDDLNDRMPRSEAGEIFGMIKQRALDIDSKLAIEIMGSYRRRKETCGDIDILITRDPKDGKTHAGVLQKLLRILHRDGIITEDLGTPHEQDSLEAKWMGIGRRDATSKRRRIDILTIPFDQLGAALLYFTGDDIFNRSMRLKANRMGYSLNQRGLYRNVIRDPTDRSNKLDSGELFASRTEREIFDALRVPWQEPWERVRG